MFIELRILDKPPSKQIDLNILNIKKIFKVSPLTNESHLSKNGGKTVIIYEEYQGDGVAYIAIESYEVIKELLLKANLLCK